MALLNLPHTRGCMVCGRDNPYGLQLRLSVDDQMGHIVSSFVPESRHMGFAGIAHGGVLATVIDEAMVWAAIWSCRRFCVCGELNVRYRQSALLGQPLRIEAHVTSVRSRLIETEGFIRDEAGKVLVEAFGKYVPLGMDRNEQFLESIVAEPHTAAAIEMLQRK